MNSFDSMKTKLESTGLYKVTAKSNIRAELLAYAEGLNTEFDMLETMERELFIDTAENCGHIVLRFQCLQIHYRPKANRYTPCALFIVLIFLFEFDDEKCN